MVVRPDPRHDTHAALSVAAVRGWGKCPSWTIDSNIVRLVISDRVRIALQAGNLIVGVDGGGALKFRETQPVLEILRAFCVASNLDQVCTKVATLVPEDVRILSRLLLDTGILEVRDDDREARLASELMLDGRQIFEDALHPSGDDGDPENWCQRAVLEIASLALAVQGQRATRPPSRSAERVHIGCGTSRIDGWLNIDRSPPADLVWDVRRGLPLPTATAQYVFTAHFLEHLDPDVEAPALLGEIRRVLRVGGVLRIVVPDAHSWLEAYCGADDTFWDEATRQTGNDWGRADRIRRVLTYMGVPPRQPSIAQHRVGYDHPYLEQALVSAGFGAIRRCGFDGSPHAELRVDRFSRAAQVCIGGRSMSLFIEAVNVGAGLAANQ